VERESQHRGHCPSTGGTGDCHYNNSSANRVISEDQTLNPWREENELLNAMWNYGTTVIGMDVSTAAFQFETSNVFDDDTCSKAVLDHEMVIVGYGSDTGGYWIMQDSWRTRWAKAGTFAGRTTAEL
jgi:hypothetical protein